jgi:hypothetical protein
LRLSALGEHWSRFPGLGLWFLNDVSVVHADEKASSSINNCLIGANRERMSDTTNGRTGLFVGMNHGHIVQKPKT